MPSMTLSTEKDEKDSSSNSGSREGGPRSTGRLVLWHPLGCCLCSKTGPRRLSMTESLCGRGCERGEGGRFVMTFDHREAAADFPRELIHFLQLSSAACVVVLSDSSASSRIPGYPAGLRQNSTEGTLGVYGGCCHRYFFAQLSGRLFVFLRDWRKRYGIRVFVTGYGRFSSTAEPPGSIAYLRGLSATPHLLPPPASPIVPHVQYFTCIPFLSSYRFCGLYRYDFNCLCSMVGNI